MSQKVYSCSVNFTDCSIIEVESAITNGLPCFSIIGLADKIVQESKERIRLSIKHTKLKFPAHRKTINLAPIEEKKHGAIFDLPIAISLLLESKQLNIEDISTSLFIGELGLDGCLKTINGAIAITEFAAKQGFKKIYLPKENAKEASFIKNIKIYPVKNLKDLVQHFNGEKKIQTVKSYNYDRSHFQIKNYKSFYLSQLAGLEKEKRALSIAATGGHNILISGPPGSGKTFLARSIMEFLPKIREKELLEILKVLSVSGLLKGKSLNEIDRPFIEVSNTTSLAKILGSLENLNPGDISLANNGVLFFDEITEFKRSILEAMRGPIENKSHNINSHEKSKILPSNFIFIGTMNPCNCGYYKNKKIKCICSVYEIKKYQSKLSGAILDRFEIFLNVEHIKLNDFKKHNNSKNYSKLITNINTAYNIQESRFKHEQNITRNKDMQLEDIKKYCVFTELGRKLLSQAYNKLNLSNRSYLNIIKLSQSISDLESSSKIKEEHISEAVQYRIKDNNLLY